MSDVLRLLRRMSDKTKTPCAVSSQLIQSKPCVLCSVCNKSQVVCQPIFNSKSSLTFPVDSSLSLPSCSFVLLLFPFCRFFFFFFKSQKHITENNYSKTVPHHVHARLKQSTGFVEDCNKNGRKVEIRDNKREIERGN